MLKKTVSIFAVAVILNLSGYLFAGEAKTDVPSKRAAVITAIKGSVEIRHDAGNAEWAAASVGAGIAQGCAVRTGKDSSATISVNGGAERITAELDSGSRFTMVDLSVKSTAGKNNTLMSLEAGKVTVKTENMSPGSVFEIKTPTSVVSSQGPSSSFNVQVERID